MTLEGFICSRECKNPPSLIKPLLCIIHMSLYSFCWRASPWTCVEDFSIGLCLRGIMGCGRTLFSHVIRLVWPVSVLQFSYEFHREKAGSVVEHRSSSSSSSGCLDRWKANYWMGFLAVCREEQSGDGIYRQQIKLLDCWFFARVRQTPCTRAHTGTKAWNRQACDIRLYSSTSFIEAYLNFTTCWKT